MKKRLSLSIILLIPIMYLSMGQMIGLKLPTYLHKNENLIFLCIVDAFLTLSVMVINKKFFVRGIPPMFKGNFNMDSLVSVSSLVSFLYSIFVSYKIINSFYSSNLSVLNSYKSSLYFESAAMILTLVTLGKFFEEKSKKKTTDAIKHLIDLAPDTATIKIDMIEKQVNISEVNVGDIVLVKSGMKIPVDGIIVGGKTNVDESCFTGESVPVEKDINSKVFTSTINLKTEIEVRVTETLNETSFSKMVEYVKKAASSKAPIAKLADKIAGKFVPMVFIISIITFISWMIINGDFEKAINFALTVLIISCPCALGLATPTAIMVGSETGAKNGIFVKNGEALEKASDIHIIAFDKTGTITKGKLSSDQKIDEIKDSSFKLIKELKNKGYKTVLISGDKKEIVEKICEHVGIDKYYYEVLPEDKALIIKELQEMGKNKVAFIGDGINDSLALISADVSLAIGAGTDVAIDSADIVVSGNDMMEVLYALNLSKLTMRTIKQNLFWAFIYNIICIPVAAGVFYNLFGIKLNPMFGAAAMCISSIFVVTNALRLRRKSIRR